MMDGQLSILKDSARKVSLGQISIESFEAGLKRFEKRLSEVASMLENLDIPEEMRLEISPELDVGSEGVRLYREAITTMQSYVSTRNLAFLQEGLEKAEKGNVKINEALQINWNNFLNWKNMTEDLLARKLREAESGKRNREERPPENRKYLLDGDF
jgi:hypothetical protein